MSGHHVSTGHRSDYTVAYSGKNLVQIVENGPDSIHWLIVREGSTEQRIALSSSALLLLCKAVSIHPFAKRVEDEQNLP